MKTLFALLLLFTGAAFAHDYPACGDPQHGVVHVLDAATGICADPAPPPDPDTTPPAPRPDRIALAGCSQTRDWSKFGPWPVGFESPSVGVGTPTGPVAGAGFDLFHGIKNFGNAHMAIWADPNGAPMTGFRSKLDGREDIILYQLCVTNDSPGDINTLRQVLDNLEGAAPWADGGTYIMPLDVSTESAGCSFAGYDRSVTLMQEAIARGWARQGPWMLPLYGPTEVQSAPDGTGNVRAGDRCHPNNFGAARQSAEVVRWLEESFQ